MSQWRYLWTGERIQGPMTSAEVRRLEDVLPPESLVWGAGAGWQPIWSDFSAPEGGPSDDAEDPVGPPPPPPPPPGRATSVTSRGGPKLVPVILLAAALLIGFVALVVSLSRSPTPVPAVPVAPSPSNPAATQKFTSEPAPPQPDVSGQWKGTMDGGRYRFDMALEQDSDGGLTARMTQINQETGTSGTERLSGTQSGNRITLRGYDWSADTPADWSLDTITAQINEGPDDVLMSGTYTCGTCSGRSDIEGRLSSR